MKYFLTGLVSLGGAVPGPEIGRDYQQEGKLHASH